MGEDTIETPPLPYDLNAPCRTVNEIVIDLFDYMLFSVSELGSPFKSTVADVFFHSIAHVHIVRRA